MSTVKYRFLEPLDVLFLRGNKLFGDPGSFGESLIPPWPSVAAGALRSRMLADDGMDLAAFARGEIRHPTLGTPKEPGAFAVIGFTLARRLAGDAVEPLFAPPADLVLSRSDSGEIEVRSLTPTATQEPCRGELVRFGDAAGTGRTSSPLQSGSQRPFGAGMALASLPEGEGLQGRASILSSAPLPQLPVLAETERGKPVSGYWITAAGWGKYLKGQTPQNGDFIHSSQLWAIDPRVGVGLDAATRRAADGRLFTVQAVAMIKRGHHIGTKTEQVNGVEKGKAVFADYDVGFLAGISGAKPPDSGTVRLGGDGRAAAIQSATPNLTEPDYEAIARNGSCRLVLTTPGIFPTGWLPTGITQTGSGELRFDRAGIKGRLVCAAVPRAETVSGWDLANRQPKPAQRAAPAGSVYWIDELDATADALRKLAEGGLWGETCHDPQRRAEGFNRVAVAAWRSA